MFVGILIQIKAFAHPFLINKVSTRGKAEIGLKAGEALSPPDYSKSASKPMASAEQPDCP
jgi:hypothetical protein